MAPKREDNQFSPSDYLTDMDGVIKHLTLRAMAAGNNGDFRSAFTDIEVALWLSQSLKMKCMEAVLLNNLGLLYTMTGAWDKGMLSFDRAMELAMEYCPSQNNFLNTLKKNISALFSPKISTHE